MVKRFEVYDAALGMVSALRPVLERLKREDRAVAEQLRRAASACEGCRLCTEACPVALVGGELAPHEVMWTLSTSRDDGTRLARAIDCVGCGVCDAACPSGLSPLAMVRAVGERLPEGVAPAPRGEPHPDRDARRMSIELLLLRAGFAPG